MVAHAGHKTGVEAGHKRGVGKANVVASLEVHFRASKRFAQAHFQPEPENPPACGGYDNARMTRPITIGSGYFNVGYGLAEHTGQPLGTHLVRLLN